MTMMTATRQEMMYCPGCSHAAVLEHIGAGLDRLGLRPEQVCLVSDIGCIGTADKYFACHTFHGLHGRSLTYAEGIKRRCPELTVIVLIGDGGCGIGTAHLVHTARRGVGLKVFVCNNFNFGMTGGQHSPTTPLAARTPTTPGGASDPPLDICQLMLASGAEFVARAGALDKNFAEMIDTTLRAPGFALLDIWELCVAYYMPQNKLTPPGLVELSENLKMPFGVLRHGSGEQGSGSGDQNAQREPARTPGAPPAQQSPSGSAGPGGRAPRATPPPVDPHLLRSWPARASICVAGSAGERIRSAVGVLGEMLVAAGLYVAQQDDYPISVRKGHSISTLTVARDPIRYTGLTAPDLLIVQSDDGLRRIGTVANLAELAADALVLANDDLPVPTTPARVAEVALKPLAQQVQRENVALALLAAGVVQRGWLTAADLRQLADGAIRGKFRDANLKALEAGLALAGA